jgi:hypothetical protein
LKCEIGLDAKNKHYTTLFEGSKHTKDKMVQDVVGLYITATNKIRKWGFFLPRYMNSYFTSKVYSRGLN